MIPKIPLSELVHIDRNAVQPEAIADGTRYVGLDCIETGGRILRVDEVSAGELASSKFAFDDRHILFGKLRPNLAKVARPDFSGICSTDILPIRPRSDVDRDYLAHYLLSPEAVAWATSRTSGANLPRLSPTVLGTLPVPLPPLPEQRRIASILDEAQNRRAKSRDLKSRLADMEFSVYQSFARAGSGSVRLGDLASFVRGVTFKPESVIDPGEEGALRFMRTTNVKDQLDTSDVKAIAPSVKVREEQILRDGDILVSTANSWNLVGRASYVAELPWPSTFGGFVSVLRPNGASVSPRFLYSWFTSPRVQATLRSFGQQTTNISNLNTARALELRVPVLNAEDRERFEKVIFKVDGLRIAVWRQESLADELVSTLRARAFRGEL
ncbi:MAG: restriction endonuclease subunit S [Microcella sp.]